MRFADQSALMKLNTSGDRPKGYALPFAIILGILMTVIALTMIARSRSYRLSTKLRIQRSQALATAEAGLARTLARLNQPDASHLFHLKYDPLGVFGTTSDDWTQSVHQPPCYEDGESFAETILRGTLVEGEQTYQLLAYRPGESVGHFLLEGRSGGVVSHLEVTVPLETNHREIAGVVATDNLELGSLNILGIDGNVVCGSHQQCEVSCSDAGQPDTENSALRRSIRASQTSEIGGRIFVGSIRLPPLPQPPRNSYALDTLQTDITLPRYGDLPGEDNNFHYRVEAINLDGSLLIDTSTSPVYLYLEGDLELTDNSRIRHSGNPADFRLFGHPNRPQIIVFNGSSCLNLFIYAPQAELSFEGQNSCLGDSITGVVWVKELNANQSNGFSIAVPSNMAAQLGHMVTTFRTASGQPTTWELRQMSEWEQEETSRE